MADTLYLSQTLHGRVRAECCDQLHAEAAHFAPFVYLDATLASFDDYVAQMRKVQSPAPSLSF